MEKNPVPTYLPHNIYYVVNKTDLSSEGVKPMWYVVQTAAGNEISAIEKCRNAMDSGTVTAIFTPKCQKRKKYSGEWRTEESVLFAGYVFLESDATAEVLEEQLKHISNVVTPVRIGGGFYPIRADEEAALRNMMDENYCICFSVGYLVDDKLVIEQGPIAGHIDQVRRIDRHRRLAELDVALWQETRRIRVGLEVKAKLTGEEYAQLRSA
ncbi:MAG TPA: hypothetical protein DHV96_06865 [Lachnospiraceae bacterium]|nr:hypothetical protein [Lachnospiraceae bacterium]